MAPWHFHPIFVHFSLSLLFIASLLFILAALYRGRTWTERCLTVARWNFWIGIVMVILTVITGLAASATVPNINELTRSAIHLHFFSAVLTVLLYLTLAFFLWRSQQKHLAPSNKWTCALVVGIALLISTGYLGGRLVFNNGVGVNAITTMH